MMRRQRPAVSNLNYILPHPAVYYPEHKVAQLTPVEPKDVMVSSRRAKNLEKKARKAKRRNASRALRGKPARRYLAKQPEK